MNVAQGADDGPGPGSAGSEGPTGPWVPGYRPYGGEVVGVVGIALVDRLARPENLLAARRRELPAPGGWELPGGKVEPGESWEAAARRELREELGIDVRLGAFVPGPAYGGLWPLGERHAMAVWLGEVASGVPAAGPAHDDLRWLAGHDLAGVDWLPADLPVIRVLAARLRRDGDAGAPPRA